MTNHIETEGTDSKYVILVTTAKGEIINHLEATTWDVDDAGRLFLYNETAIRLNAVATYNTNAWDAVTRVTEEVYQKVAGTDKANKETKDPWLAKRGSNRRKLQGD